MRENLIIQVVEEGEQINLVINDAAYTISTWGNWLGEIENQTDLMEILNGKLDAAEVTDEAEPGKVLRLNEHGQLVADVIGNATTATEVAWDGVSSKPPTFPPAAHNLLSHPDWPGDVDLVQLAALAGVTGPIQTQINAKQDPLTAGDIRAALADANPGLEMAHIGLVINQRGWLQEMRLCYGRNFMPATCSRARYGPADDRPVRIWRGL